MAVDQRLPHESAREYVYRLLKDDILNLNLAPGQSLSEQEIAARFEVSRTPVREAFIRLSQENLLDILPQKGTYVSLIDLEKVDESKFVREILEREIIRLACVSFPGEELFQLQSSIALQELCIQEKNYQRFFELDESMHGIIFRGCNKARTWHMLQQMNVHYNRVRIMTLTVRYDWELLLQQHKDLVQAIRDHNIELGQRTLDRHLNKVVFDLECLRKDYGHYFVPVK